MRDEVPYPDGFGQDLKKYRATHKLKNVEIARATGLNEHHISRCVSGTRNLSLNSWRVLGLYVEKKEIEGGE